MADRELLVKLCTTVVQEARCHPSDYLERTGLSSIRLARILLNLAVHYSLIEVMN